LYRLKKYIKNITSIFIAFILLSGGNFAYAIAHGDCVQVSNGYITCEMECCEDNPCVDDEGGKVILKDDSKSCCQLHIEQTVEQDLTLPVILKKTEISKLFSFNLISTITLNESTGFVPVIHKFKTSNILLTTSILRI
jgi:hypothetical protein